MVNYGTCIFLAMLFTALAGFTHAICLCNDLESRISVLEGQMARMIESHHDNITESFSHGFFCPDMEVNLCDIIQTGNEYTTLVASRPGTFPSAGMCRVVSRVNNLDLDRYAYTVELYNQDSSRGPTVGHPGVAFNVIDSNNFDFIYFRPHWADRIECVQHGYLMSGLMHDTTVDLCIGAPVVGSTWMKVKVESADGRATVYIDDVMLNSVNAHFPTRSQAGIIVLNGFGNVIRFRNTVIRKLT